MFTPAEVARYAAQIRLPEIGGTGQQKLKAADVVIVGAGGLGSPVALYLGAAGVGHLTISDGDLVEESNLNRQIVFEEGHVNGNKAFETMLALRYRNTSIVIDSLDHIKEADAEFLADRTLVIDCTDNYETRSLLNRVCRQNGVPLLSGAVAGWQGHVALYEPQGACYACWVQPPKQSDPCGVLGAVAGIVGTIMATEAVKLIVGLEPVTRGNLLLVNGLTMETSVIPLARDSDCTVCQ